ncbi:HD domain-containing protein [Devosia sp. MC532]|uniref:HD domain-containing protein n=1 Tax=Devosia sp. MC532 TaxID=2799788 RepID=UPI0018F6383C|nr:HD domain-containing protein [Devosia sp. MC532]MBJ7579364.1 HD domain-containing protein [Devosia sp. MC532]
MSPLELALATALKVHQGQTDKGGAPYILHPIRVMMQLESDAERIVGLLHDSVEDCVWYTLDKVEDDFGTEIRAAVDAITKRAGEDYPEYLQRVKANEIARKVKLADLNDNSDTGRLGREVDASDLKRLEKYAFAHTFLSA